MVGFFANPLWRIKRCIEKLRTSDTKKVIVTGGFGRSQYLINQLKTHFEHGNVDKVHIDGTYHGGRSDRAVSNGGMLRWPEIVSVDFDKTSYFGLAEEQEFDEKVHLDAVMEPHRVMESPYDDTAVVEDRWVPLVSKV